MKPTPRIPQIMHRALRIVHRALLCIVHWNKLRIAPRAAQLSIIHYQLLILLLASCQQETLSPLSPLLPPDGEIRITASVNNPSPFEGSRGAVTRAGMDSETLDRFGLYINNPAAAKYSYDNELIQKVSGVWTHYNPDTDTPLLWGSANQEVTVTAYYPHYRSEYIEDGGITSGVIIDQTQPHQVWASDLLWAQSAVTPSAPDTNNDIHYNASTKSLVVQMNHVLSKLRVNIRYGSSLMPDNPSTPTQSTAPTLGDVTLSGTRLYYKFTPADGKVALHPDLPSPYDIKMYHEPASAVTPGQHATCEAIIVPQTAAFSLKIVADGKTYTYTHPTTSGTGGYTFEPDKIYILNLVVGKDAVTLGSVTVKEWSKDTPLPDGNATPAPFTDPEFVKALTAEPHNVPTDANGRIDPTNAATKEALEKITELNVSEKGIKSLRGIEYLTGLTRLECDNNSLTTLDVSQNKALETLGCNNNSLTALDVSQNKALTYLNCSINSLAALDVSGCTALTTLYGNTNSLTTLDVSGCTALTYLICADNSLTTLDVSQNKALTMLYCHANRLATLDITAFTNDLTAFTCGYQEDDNGADRTITLTLTKAQKTTIETAGWDIGKNVEFDPYVAFSDPAFVAVLVNTYGVPTDPTTGRIDPTNPTTQEALAAITTLSVSDNANIRSLRGIEHLTGLTQLIANRCTALTTLNVRGCKKLTNLDATDCIALTALDVRGLTGLTSLSATDCTALTTLNAGGCTALTKLTANRSTALTTLNADGCEALTQLHCNDNRLTTLDVSSLTKLTVLHCNGNRLTTLDVSSLTKLTELQCDGNRLTTLDITALPASMDAFTCGNQQDGRKLSLLLRKDQQPMWERFSGYQENAGVTAESN